MDEIVVAIQNAANTIATPNWADIMSVCFSLAAVVVACIVAWRQNEISRKQTDIADKQNKIALFEKRLEIFDILSSCSTSVQILKMLDKDGDVLQDIFCVFLNDSIEHRKFNRDEARIYLTNCSAKLRRARFFFSDKIASYITAVSVPLLSIANSDAKVDGPKKYNEKKQAYFEAIKNVEEDWVIESIMEEMKMV